MEKDVTGTDGTRPVSIRAFSGRVAGVSLADIKWVSSVIGLDGVTAKQAPSSGAWNLLQWVSRSPANESAFWTSMVPKILPTRSAIDEGDRLVDDGRDVTDLLTRVLNEIREGV